MQRSSGYNRQRQRNDECHLDSQLPQRVLPAERRWTARNPKRELGEWKDEHAAYHEHDDPLPDPDPRADGGGEEPDGSRDKLSDGPTQEDGPNFSLSIGHSHRTVSGPCAVILPSNY
jgi:hypothetical protein